MSAFQVSPECMDNVIRAICAPAYYREVGRTFGGFVVEQSKSWDQIGRALFAMNNEAICQRYPRMRDTIHDFQDYSFKDIPYMQTRADLVECYKAAQCLRYQCAEGDVPETNPLFEELGKVILELQERIVAELDEYKAAAWG
jgi:hypothetical protein